MLQSFKSLGRETAVYGLSTVLARLLNLFLLPLYTHVLSPADYGITATVFSYIAFFNVIYGYGMDFAFMRHSPSGLTGRERYFSVAFWSLAATSLLFSCLIHVSGEPISRAAAIPQSLVRYAAWILALDALACLPFAELRMSHRAAAYSGVKACNIVINLALNYVFLVSLRLGIEGIFLAALLSSCATFAMLSPLFISQLKMTFDFKIYKDLLRFALPLVPAGLASMVVHVIDRPVLKFMADDAAVGIYQANYRLGIFMMMAVGMFDAAWRPFFIEKAGEKQGKELLARVLTYFVLGAGCLFLLLTLFIPWIVALPLFKGKPLIAQDYWSGLPVVPVVTLAYLFNGIYVNMLAPVTLAKRSELVAYAAGIGAMVNVAANLFWIPRWGMMGAAASALAAYLSMAAALFAMGRRVYPIPYEYRRLAHIALALIAVLFAAWMAGIGMAADKPLWRLAWLAAFPAALAATGFFNKEERGILHRATLGR